MDLLIHASAYSLGVKRSAIKLPWELDHNNAIFGKRPKLISPPVFAPLTEVEEGDTLLATRREGGQDTLVKADIGRALADRSGEIIGTCTGILEGHCHGQS